MSVSKIDVATCPLLLWWTMTSCLSPPVCCRPLRFLLFALLTRMPTTIASTTNNRLTVTAVISTGETFNTSTPNPAKKQTKIQKVRAYAAHLLRRILCGENGYSLFKQFRFPTFVPVTRFRTIGVRDGMDGQKK